MREMTYRQRVEGAYKMWQENNDVGIREACRFYNVTPDEVFEVYKERKPREARAVKRKMNSVGITLHLNRLRDFFRSSVGN